MGYITKKIGKHKIDFYICGSDTMAIFIDDILDGDYNYTQNIYIEKENSQISKLTEKQKKALYIEANKIFMHEYKNFMYNSTKSGAFFAPTESNYKKQVWIARQIEKIKDNIRGLQGILLYEGSANSYEEFKNFLELNGIKWRDVEYFEFDGKTNKVRFTYYQRGVA
jgi:hypothetical protein